MPTNFLSDYRLFTSGDEAPENYHIWSGLSALASVVGRRCWADWGRFRIYPNLYVVLLGPPGNGKTTAMSISKGIIREVGNIPFSAQAQTKESLVKEMADYERSFKVGETSIVHTPVSIFVTELSHFLGPASGHMIDFLTTIYGEDVYDNKTKNKGNDLIIGPCVNLLACTTPAWITTYLRSDIISGGFTRRAVFINEDEGTVRTPFPDLNAPQTEARTRLVEYARQLSDVAGPFTWDGPARSFFADWYVKFQLPVDLSVRWYYRTKHIQIIKVTLLVALAETFEKVIRKHHLEIAMALMERIESNLVRVFQGMGRNELHTVSQKLIDIITLAGGALPEKQVLVAMGREANMQELYHVMDYLQKTDAIVKFSETRSGVARQMVGLKRFVEEEIERRKDETHKENLATGNPPILERPLQTSRPDNESTNLEGGPRVVDPHPGTV